MPLMAEMALINEKNDDMIGAQENYEINTKHDPDIRVELDFHLYFLQLSVTIHLLELDNFFNRFIEFLFLFLMDKISGFTLTCRILEQSIKELIIIFDGLRVGL